MVLNNKNLLTQREVPLAPTKGLHGPGPLNPLTSNQSLGTQIAHVVSMVIGFLTVLAGLWFLIETVVSGYLFIIAGNDQEKLKEAKQRLGQALIGFIVVIGAIILGNLVSYIAGVDFLNLADFVDTLSF